MVVLERGMCKKSKVVGGCLPYRVWNDEVPMGNDMSYYAKAPLEGDIGTKCGGDLQQSTACRLSISD